MKNVLLKLLPFHNRKNMTPFEYMVKKVLAFVLIYFVGAAIGEAIIIGILTGLGYDPIHGDIPEMNVQFLMLKYFGYAIFTLLTLLYCKVIEKRSVKSVFGGKALDYLTGSLLGAGFLAVIILVCCATGSLSFAGISTKTGLFVLLLCFLGFVIQSMCEEVMCRGFLM